jgi:hypothetical protein
VIKLAIDKEKQKQKSIVFPRELFKKIEKEAKKQNRSFSAQVVHICQIYYSKD